MMNFESSLESTKSRETVCMTAAAAIHLLLLLWNPVMLKSEFKPIHDFVSVDLVESSPGGGNPAPEPPAKMGLMDTLKDMLMKPKMDQIALNDPSKQVAAAPQQPLLKEATRRPMPMSFTPQAQNDDLAALKNPDAIKAPGTVVPNMPVGGPTLQSKSFGGIRMKDLPFQVSGPESISANQVSNIPIAVGNNSAKSGLGYTGPSLQEASNRRVGIVPGASGTGAPNDTMALASAAPAPIAVGTGGTGNAPTGPSTGGNMVSRGGGLVNRGLGGGSGGGRGSGVGTGIEGGMPGAASQLDAQLSQGGAGASKKAKGKGFEIAGPLTNRPISHKVIPQYPAWAEEQGIMGSVRLYFTVDAAGNVRSGIRVTKTTGYPALDQLGIDALKQWKFSPLGGEDEGTGQWGIITFNFSLSS